jgi:Flp pilus assembly protein TadG
MSRTFTFANAATHCPEGRTGAKPRRLRGEEGAALLEYALIFILFMMLLFGIMGMGQMLYSYHFVSSVARDATRWAAVNGSTCNSDGSCTAPAQPGDVKTYVTNHTPLGIDSSQVTTTPTWNPAGSNGPTACATTDNLPGCTVEVKVSYKYTFVFPLIRTTPLTLSSTSEMIIAH